MTGVCMLLGRHDFKKKMFFTTGAGVCYWWDIFMGFSTGFVVIYNLRRKVIRDPALIAEYYMRYSTFILDLLAALPVIAEVRSGARKCT